MSYRNKKLLKAAREYACVLCGKGGTTVAAHANSVALGKGTGIKAPDYYVAYVCHECHDRIDGRRYDDDPQGLWTRAYLKTVALWFEKGLVIVP
jgi:DNA-directed RNA polymerase subunit RPC12/RpoP